MVAWENSREVVRNEKSFGLFPFHHRGQRFGLVPALECHLLGAGLRSFEVTCLASLCLGDIGHKKAQAIPEPGLQEEGWAIQGMWMKTVVEGRAASRLGELQKLGLGHQGTTESFCQELNEPKVSYSGCSS